MCGGSLSRDDTIRYGEYRNYGRRTLAACSFYAHERRALMSCLLSCIVLNWCFGEALSLFTHLAFLVIHVFFGLTRVLHCHHALRLLPYCKSIPRPDGELSLESIFICVPRWLPIAEHLCYQWGPGLRRLFGSPPE
eukprot:11375201-Karenia_brevis.AAC.1